jgi:hypothetical protein
LPTFEPSLEQYQSHSLQHAAAFGVTQTVAAKRPIVFAVSGKLGGSRLIPGCRLGDAMKRYLRLATGAGPLLATHTVWAQNGHMMSGGMWGGGWMGGYGGIWGLVLLVIVVAAVVAWAFRQR